MSHRTNHRSTRHDKTELIPMLILITASIFTSAALLLALVEKIKTLRLEAAQARLNARLDAAHTEAVRARGLARSATRQAELWND